MKFFIIIILISSSYQHRDKRFIFINPTAKISLGYLISLPLALALPTISVEERSLNVADDINFTEDLDDGLFFYYDPNYLDSISKLNAYFSYMGIPSLSCQERLICELAAQPEAFAPATDIILKELRQEHGPVEKLENSLMWRYMTAAKEGFSKTIKECAHKYRKCPMPAHKLLNMPVLKVWQFISTKIGIQLL